MIINYPQSYNIHEIEKHMKKGSEKFVAYLDGVYKKGGIDALITTIKSSGLYLNLFNDEMKNELTKSVTIYFESKLVKDELIMLVKLIQESLLFSTLIYKFNEQKEKHFKDYPELNESNMAVSYILALERYLSSLDAESDIKAWRVKVGQFDSAAESTGMILKSFMYSNYAFYRTKNDISEKLLDASSKHLDFSVYWTEIDNLINIWKYSTLKIEEFPSLELFKFEIIDKVFELNNLVSNARFMNLKNSWEISALGEVATSYDIKDIKVKEQAVKAKKNELNYLVATLVFGTYTLEELVDNVKLHKWLTAYQLLVEESKKFLKQRTYSKYNLKDYCLSKTKKQWKMFFVRNGFNKSEFEVIFSGFVFNKKSQDLIDCPFIQFDDLYVIVPSLLANSDIPRALASNFLNRRLELSFRGNGFEDRTRADLDAKKIKNTTLYKRDNGTEYQCDIVFKIDTELYFVECKAHVQPYTTRQHTNHLYKLYEETAQINRIADYFIQNLDFVKSQLKLDPNEVISNTHRLIITTSMVGSPLCINGVYIVDESSFNTFINRTKPSLKIVNKNEFTKLETNKFEMFNGNITSEKMIEFLKSPPQIEITREFMEERTIELGNIILTRNFEIHSTIHMGNDINKFTEDFANKYYVKKSELYDLLNK